MPAAPRGPARPARALAVLSLAVAANAAGNLLLSDGLRDRSGTAPLADLGDLLGLVGACLGTPRVLAGLGLLVGFFVLFLSLLSWADVSWVVPMLSSCFAVNSLLAAWILGESVPAVRWAGIALVSIGVALVGTTTREAARDPGAAP